jgi:hypothetical protein
MDGESTAGAGESTGETREKRGENVYFPAVRIVSVSKTGGRRWNPSD